VDNSGGNPGVTLWIINGLAALHYLLYSLSRQGMMPPTRAT
jgi:hypothetical protein